MNRVTLLGRLTRDPEERRTSTGRACARFTLATNDGKSTAGQELVNFIPCIAWGPTAELILSSLKKGRGIVTDNASIQTGSFEDSEGNSHKVFQVVVKSFSYLEPKPKEEGNADGKSKRASELNIFGEEVIDF